MFCFVLLSLRLNMKKDSLKNPSAMEKMKHLDSLKIVLLLDVCNCLFLALQWDSSNFSWFSNRIIGLMIGFGFLIIVFSILQWQLAEKTAISLRILNQHTVFSETLALFFSFMFNNIVKSSVLLWILKLSAHSCETTETLLFFFYFEAARGGSAFRNGIEFLAFAIPQVVATIMTDGFAIKIGHYVSHSSPLFWMALIKF